MKMIVRLALSILLAGTVSAAAQAHAKLEGADPVPNSVLAKPPGAIQLKFNESLEPAFSKITITDAANRSVQLPAVTVGMPGRKQMTVALPPLGAGVYHVQWTTMTRDGHKAKGEFNFTVK